MWRFISRAANSWRSIPTWLKKDLAAALHFDASMVTRILSVDELIPEAKEAFLAGKFGFSKAYAIVRGRMKTSNASSPRFSPARRVMKSREKVVSVAARILTRRRCRG